MRVISQDGTLDVPYNDYQLFVIGAKYDAKVARIYCQSSYAPSVKIAEYSTNAKALKAMEMLREHNEGVTFLKTIINTEKGNLFVSGLSKTDFNKLTQNYFQFPQDDEIEV
jgi:hypothetical protein|nr:MAG TPA: hypothetical protein [Caudoviricetes sp.]